MAACLLQGLAAGAYAAGCSAMGWCWTAAGSGPEWMSACIAAKEAAASGRFLLATFAAWPATLRLQWRGVGVGGDVHTAGTLHRALPPHVVRF